jgi:RNA polymerase sigma factor (sigma-70 family)
MRDLGDEEATSSFLARICFIARARYGILPQDAEDIFHEAVATYLTVHTRYDSNDNHYGLLVGIFHKKALEHLGARDRAGRMARRLVTRLRSERPIVARGEDPLGTTSEIVIREEDAQLIRDAIDSMQEEGRELLLALAEGRLTRLEMIEQLNVNPNTFDTRLRALRLKLKRKLLRSGVL